MKLTTTQKWRKTLGWLRRNFPTQFPVTVRSVQMKDDGETSEYKGPQFIILINRNKSLAVRIDSILHEWAHVLTWFGAGHYEEHPDEFGLCWAKIYRTFIEWNYGRERDLGE